MMAFGIIVIGVFYVFLPLLSFLFGTTKGVGFAITNPNPESNMSLYSFAFGSFMIIGGLALLIRIENGKGELRERKGNE